MIKNSHKEIIYQDGLICKRSGDVYACMPFFDRKRRKHWLIPNKRQEIPIFEGHPFYKI